MTIDYTGRDAVIPTFRSALERLLVDDPELC
jgi:hypothetical protein